MSSEVESVFRWTFFSRIPFHQQNLVRPLIVLDERNQRLLIHGGYCGTEMCGMLNDTFAISIKRPMIGACKVLGRPGEPNEHSDWFRIQSDNLFRTCGRNAVMDKSGQSPARYGHTGFCFPSTGTLVSFGGFDSLGKLTNDFFVVHLSIETVSEEKKKSMEVAQWIRWNRRMSGCEPPFAEFPRMCLARSGQVLWVVALVRVYLPRKQYRKSKENVQDNNTTPEALAMQSVEKFGTGRNVKPKASTSTIVGRSLATKRQRRIPQRIYARRPFEVSLHRIQLSDRYQRWQSFSHLVPTVLPVLNRYFIRPETLTAVDLSLEDSTERSEETEPNLLLCVEQLLSRRFNDSIHQQCSLWLLKEGHWRTFDLPSECKFARLTQTVRLTGTCQYLVEVVSTVGVTWIDISLPPSAPVRFNIRKHVRVNPQFKRRLIFAESLPQEGEELSSLVVTVHLGGIIKKVLIR